MIDSLEKELDVSRRDLAKEVGKTSQLQQEVNLAQQRNDAGVAEMLALREDVRRVVEDRRLDRFTTERLGDENDRAKAQYDRDIAEMLALRDDVIRVVEDRRLDWAIIERLGDENDRLTEELRALADDDSER